jgi:hypothetical protein
MNWQPISNFPIPTVEWEFKDKHLFYSPEEGIKIGICVLMDAEENYFTFQDDSSSGFKMRPTHWMPLPEIPD